MVDALVITQLCIRYKSRCVDNILLYGKQPSQRDRKIERGWLLWWLVAQWLCTVVAEHAHFKECMVLTSCTTSVVLRIVYSLSMFTLDE